jgi:hypothetical protein
MNETAWTEVDTQRAIAAWDEYQRSHDVSGLKGKTAGIEPESGRVWIGESGLDVSQQMESEGIHRPFYAVRIGYDYYIRKGGRR